METKTRNILIDYLKAFFIVCVINHHTFIFYNGNIVERIIFTLIINMAVPGFMILSGYTSSMSCKRDVPLRKLYDFGKIKRRFWRYTIPYCITYAFFAVCSAVLGVSSSSHSFIGRFFYADFGMGAYYYMLMVELLFIFPILYRIIDKFAARGLIGIAMANLMFEIAAPRVMTNEIYRLLIFRYLTFIALGIYLKLYLQDSFNQRKIKDIILSGGGYMYRTCIFVITFLRIQIQNIYHGMGRNFNDNRILDFSDLIYAV